MVHAAVAVVHRSITVPLTHCDVATTCCTVVATPRAAAAAVRCIGRCNTNCALPCTGMLQLRMCTAHCWCMRFGALHGTQLHVTVQCCPVRFGVVRGNGTQSEVARIAKRQRCCKCTNQKIAAARGRVIHRVQWHCVAEPQAVNTLHVLGRSTTLARGPLPQNRDPLENKSNTFRQRLPRQHISIADLDASSPA